MIKGDSTLQVISWLRLEAIVKPQSLQGSVHVLVQSEPRRVPAQVCPQFSWMDARALSMLQCFPLELYHSFT
jgi:hypothetical protein